VLETANIHGTAVAVNGHGVLILGASGTGKSDLALRLIDRGAKLVSDDQVFLTSEADMIMMSAPDTISGKIEIRHLGIMQFKPVTATLKLIIDLDSAAERFPENQKSRDIMGTDIPVIALNAFENSAAIKVELALGAHNRQDAGHG